MSISTILENIPQGTAVLAVLFTLVQIAPIRINPWTWLCKWIGKAMNGELMEQVQHIAKRMDDMEVREAEKEAIAARNRILRFGDEIRNGERHSAEYFRQMMDDITAYQHYCDTHPQFKNERTVQTIKIIDDVYERCVRTNDFL